MDDLTLRIVALQNQMKAARAFMVAQASSTLWPSGRWNCEAVCEARIAEMAKERDRLLLELFGTLDVL